MDCDIKSIPSLLIWVCNPGLQSVMFNSPQTRNNPRSIANIIGIFYSDAHPEHEVGKQYSSPTFLMRSTRPHAGLAEQEAWGPADVAAAAGAPLRSGDDRGGGAPGGGARRRAADSCRQSCMEGGGRRRGRCSSHPNTQGSAVTTLRTTNGKCRERSAI